LESLRKCGESCEEGDTARIIYYYILPTTTPTTSPPSVPKMSDYGDEMDVDMEIDVPAADTSSTMLFTSDHASKGKRSSANLPVGAEDTLPWCVTTISSFLLLLLFPYTSPFGLGGGGADWGGIGICNSC
jgi:hypothetical protein